MITGKTTLLGAGICFVLSGAAHAADPNAVVETYADIALAKYEDSLTATKSLDEAIDALIARPSKETLGAARQSWRAARVPYQQTEVYRFGNPVVDAWEGKVNSWPLDEGLIDYVAVAYGTESDRNELYTLNVIANPHLTVNGQPVDASAITPTLLSETLHEAEGIEANVATGYHAIEFLLWGQDLNGTGPGAGERPHTDYDPDNCTGGHCERRAEYLKAASELLISDLKDIVAAWKPGGEARAALMTDPESGLAAILTGMGSLSYGELAGERMKLGLLLRDPEEEHDCFSDNTHNSHFYNQVGIQNVFNGHYERIDGSVVSGPSIADLIAEEDPELKTELAGKLQKTRAAMEKLRARAEAGEAYDQMIGEGNPEGNAIVQAAIDGLIDQTRSIERAVAALGLSHIDFEGSESLDDPGAVFQ